MSETLERPCRWCKDTGIYKSDADTYTFCTCAAGERESAKYQTMPKGPFRIVRADETRQTALDVLAERKADLAADQAAEGQAMECAECAAKDAEIARLSYELTLLGDRAVVDWDSATVGEVDRVLPMPEIPKTYKEARKAELALYDRQKAEIARLQTELVAKSDEPTFFELEYSREIIEQQAEIARLKAENKRLQNQCCEFKSNLYKERGKNVSLKALLRESLELVEKYCVPLVNCCPDTYRCEYCQCASDTRKTIIHTDTCPRAAHLAALQAAVKEDD